MRTYFYLKSVNQLRRLVVSLKRFKSTALPFISSETLIESNNGSDEFLTGTILPITVQPELFRHSCNKHPVFRILNKDGNLLNNSYRHSVDRALAEKLLNTMIRLRAMDYVFYNAQRQGRISFYMTSTGEEASQIGSASALDDEDIIFSQYRESGILMWRGFSLQNFANQCFSNEHDLGLGRQMPVHYGSRAHYFQTVSSPLATQIPQAAGAAYALKRQQFPNVTVCYFGEGAASEGDFHAGLNFASTLDCPVIFFCRNNGYAISTPVKDQYRGDGIISRASGYGMAAIRIDGNDILAVHEATKISRDYAITHNKPVLIEAMTYRVGHHSTSDDWKSYRSSDEVEKVKKSDDPITRFLKFLNNESFFSSTYEETYEREKQNVLMALEVAEQSKLPPISTMFKDVYYSLPKSLIEQEKSMFQHIKKYENVYSNM